MRKSKYNRKLFLFVSGIALTVILSISACQKSPAFDCFKSTGEIKKVERNISYFHSIQLNDNINLHLQQSNELKLELEAGSNLMSKIVTEVTEDSVLIIGNDNSCNWVRNYNTPINVYLNFKELRNIEYRSIGDITNTDSLRLDSLQIDIYEGAGKIELTLRTFVCETNLHYGTADVILKGRCVAGVYYQLGAGRIDAQNFEATSVYLRNWSSNDMFVNAKKVLSAEIKGLGNVYYRGNPGIESSILGEGKLMPIQ